MLARPSRVALAAALGLAAGVVGGVTVAHGGGPFAVWAGQPATALAQATVGSNIPGTPGISVVGDGVVNATPDTTTIRFGVQVAAGTPAAALDQTRQGTERLLQQLRQRGVSETDLQTAELNVFPVQGPGKAGPPEPPAITGYQGTAAVVVKGQDVNRAGALMDAAMQAGATSVQGLSFGLKDDAELRRQALAAAIRDARPKAEAAAAAAGLTLGAVRSVEEAPFGGPVPAGGLGGGMGSAGVAPGQLTVAARAQVTFDVSR